VRASIIGTEPGLPLGFLKLGPVARRVRRQFERVSRAALRPTGFDDAHAAFEVRDPPTEPIDKGIRSREFGRELLDRVFGEAGSLFQSDQAGFAVFRIPHGCQIICLRWLVRVSPDLGTVCVMIRYRFRISAIGLTIGIALGGWGLPAASAQASTGSIVDRLAGSLALGAALSENESEATQDSKRVPKFGERHSHWWGVSASGMIDDNDNKDYSLRFSYHYFAAEDFEVNLALTGWFHDQPNDDEFSGSFDFGFRYHFLTGSDKRWSVYADTGIGLLVSSGSVPEGGTDVNFTPRAGVGLTMRLPEGLGGEAGGRLDLGVGWQHYSNASTAGSDRNPARDSIIVRVGVMFPF